MKSNEIRQLFCDFFVSKDHVHLPGSSLIPTEDPTLLFTNAGMVQFKTIFLGSTEAFHKRAVTVQKCLRAGGKHNDLENVGKTSRHHTFFEMLGNFSFGDYFKEEAITWGWEFLTGWVKLPADKLWVSVHEKDDEAFLIWNEKIGVSKERIVHLGDKDNFWQMGDKGPCGPCSEILIDQGPKLGCGKADCAPGCDCDRYLELWNLVFMQYDRDSEGTLTPLPRPSIDTGMGLERLTTVLQGKHNNFDSDLFMPLIENVSSISGKPYGKEIKYDVSIRVIADHLRAITFVLDEGCVPSNEGRGYVLRRIIRRAARHGFMLGIEEPFLYRLLELVVKIMGPTYHSLYDSFSVSKRVLESEEKRFNLTLTYGLNKVDELIASLKESDTISGQELFKLYDTFGFPIDLVQDIADERGLKLDYEGFNQEMDSQKERARASWTGTKEMEKGVFKTLVQILPKTEFLGYETIEADASLLAIVKDSSVVDMTQEGEEVELVFNRTPCYAEAGGQVGDKAIVTNGNTRIEIKDTQNHQGVFTHKAKVISGSLHTSKTFHIAVEEERRNAIRRNHTATHLLHAALKQILGDHVKQAGSLVTSDRLRFDFTHFTGLKIEEIQEVEELVNQKIIENIPVQVQSMTLDEAIRSGAVALFGEKYGETVRVVRAEKFSSELCGGTHCHATGDIGPFKIVSEGSVAAGIRRIEAITGFDARNYYVQTDHTLSRIAEQLKTDKNSVEERIQNLIKSTKNLQKEIDKLKSTSASRDIEFFPNEAIEVKGIKVLTKRMDNLDMKTLREVADKIKNLLQSGVIVLASVLGNKVFYVATVTKDHTNHVKAGEILTVITNGKGGGRPDMAQGGTNDVDSVDKALASVKGIVEEKVRSWDGG